MAGQGVTAYLLLSLGIAAIGSMQFGLHLAELNAPQDVITCRQKVISFAVRAVAPDADDMDCIPMSEAVFGTISSIFTIGGLIGALAAGSISSKRGRLFAMRVTADLYLLGSLLESVSSNAPFLALGRLVSGMGAGISTVVVPLYISELCPPDKRGFFGFSTQVSINTGILLAQTLGFFLSYGSAWRWILRVGIIFAVALRVGLLMVPETPVWLASHGQVAQAHETMRRIRGRNADFRDEVRDWGLDAAAADGSGEEEAFLARAQEDDDDAPPPNATAAKNEPVHLDFMDVVRDPSIRPVIIALVGIMFVQQFCGINSVVMYSVSLLSDLLPFSSALLSIFISIANLVTTMACAPLPDRLGRKTCLMLSIIGQGSSALVLALSIVFGFKIISAVAVVSFVCFFGVGLGPVPFILASELVGQEAIGATQSWCLGANYIATFIVAQFFPIVNKLMNSWLGGAGWVYFIFAAMAAASAVFVSWSFRSLRFQSARGN